MWYSPCRTQLAAAARRTSRISPSAASSLSTANITTTRQIATSTSTSPAATTVLPPRHYHNNNSLFRQHPHRYYSSTASSSSQDPAGAAAAESSTTTPAKPDFLDAAESSIWDLLVAEFSPSALAVQDISGGCGSMYGIEIESERFRGQNMLKQQRMVNAALGEQVKQWHGVQLRTRVPPS